jgi:HAD superfamily hydrolase (TIGR01549 family)
LIKNIFLDAGGVILNENTFEEQSANIITGIIRHHNADYSIEKYRNDVEEAVYRFVPKVYDYVLYKNINDINIFSEAKKQYKNELKNRNIPFALMAGINDFLISFSENYRIGILGQYGNDFKKYLEDMNILQYFTFTEIQDDYKITKPDPGYFRAILEKCNCRAEESIMVGDRIDKDIIPAKMTGMKTIRVKTGIHKNQEPRTPDEMPDLTVETIEEITVEAIEGIEYNNT